MRPRVLNRLPKTRAKREALADQGKFENGREHYALHDSAIALPSTASTALMLERFNA